MVAMLKPAILLSVAVFIVVPACQVGPDYTGPPTGEVDVPLTFGEAGDPAFVANVTDMRTWWTVFDDPILNELVDTAARDNQDLRIALSRVNEARVRVDIAGAARTPQVSFGGGAAATNDATTGMSTRVRSNAGLSASWELDVFGKIARTVESAEAQYQATEEDRRDVQVSLFAEVARAYLSARSLQAQLEAAQNNIESQRTVLHLTEVRLRDGLSSGLDASQARQVLASSEAAIPPLRIALAREINTIALLLGTHPQGMHAKVRDPGPIPTPPATVAVGVPANLLRQRPDIRAAERRLAAQSAQVGIATADLYPSFAIEGNLGFAATGSDNLLDAASRSFALGPSLRWSIFDGGRVRNQIKVEDFKLEQAVLVYERTVLEALEEVESAMTAFIEQRIRVDAIERASSAARETLNFALKLYKDDLAGFQDVLDAQRQLFSAESEAAEARGLAAQNLVALYRALGGGWEQPNGG